MPWHLARECYPVFARLPPIYASLIVGLMNAHLYLENIFSSKLNIYVVQSEVLALLLQNSLQLQIHLTYPLCEYQPRTFSGVVTDVTASINMMTASSISEASNASRTAVLLRRTQAFTDEKASSIGFRSGL